MPLLIPVGSPLSPTDIPKYAVTQQASCMQNVSSCHIFLMLATACLTAEYTGYRTSPPRKSQSSRRRLPMVHFRPASMGVMSSFRSLPTDDILSIIDLSHTLTHSLTPCASVPDSLPQCIIHLLTPSLTPSLLVLLSQIVCLIRTKCTSNLCIHGSFALRLRASRLCENVSLFGTACA